MTIGDTLIGPPMMLQLPSRLVLTGDWTGVLVYIAVQVHDDEQLAEELNLDPEDVAIALRRLEDRGWIVDDHVTMAPR